MRFTWDERKRKSNLRKHGLDFADAANVFEGPTVTYEDERLSYDEPRFVTLGLLRGVAVSMVHTEAVEQIGVISLDERLEMKKRSSSKASKTDWRRLRAMKDSDIELSDEHPELDVKRIAKAIVRRGLKPVPPKASVSLRVDADVLEWFKAHGPGYQTRINAVLRAFKEASL